MDVSGVGFKAGLLQVKEGMKCPHDEVLNSKTRHPTAFANKAYSLLIQGTAIMRGKYSPYFID